MGGETGVFVFGSDVTARMNPFGFSFFLFSFPPRFCVCFPEGAERKALLSRCNRVDVIEL